MAYAEVAKITRKDLVATHSIRLGLALNFSVAWYEVPQGPHEARVILQERSRERIVEEIIDVPVPLMIEGNYRSCEAPVREAQWSVSLTCQFPQIRKETGELIQLFVQERISDRVVGQMVDVLVPEIRDMKSISRERLQECTKLQKLEGQEARILAVGADETSG